MPLIPSFKKQLTNFKSLAFTYRQFVSMRSQLYMDQAGNFMPWYTYPAWEYLKQLDLREKNVFEFGIGSSSLFWAAKAKQVMAVESSSEWFKKIAMHHRSNLFINLATQKEEYLSAIATHQIKYDIIIIDGDHRLACAQLAKAHLANGGMIILDNADWFHQTVDCLRSFDFIQVDFAGFGPFNQYTWTTSIFFDRHFKTNKYSIDSLAKFNSDMREE